MYYSIRMESWVLTLFSELKCINVIYFDAHIVPDWASGGGPFKLSAVKDSS